MSFAPINKLADGAFTAGPKDNVAAADVYKLTSSAKKTINSIQDSVGALDTSIFSSFGKDIGDMMSKVGDSISFDSTAITDRIMETSANIKNGFRELTGSMKDSALVTTFKDKSKELSCMIGDYKSMAAKANVRDVNALGRFVNEYTGTKIFSSGDKGALAGVLGAVVNKSSELGVTGVFTKLTSTLTDNGLIAKVVKTVAPIALKNGDMKLLRELSSSPAGKLINVFQPGFTNTIARTFSQTNYSKRASFNTYEDFFTAIGNVNDQWDVLERGNGDTAVNIFSLLGGSKDFQKLLLSGVTYFATQENRPDKPEYALATIYTQTTVYQDIKRFFPSTVIIDLEKPSYNRMLPARRSDEIKPMAMVQRALSGFFS